MMIRSVGYALSWEYWRRGTAWFVPACVLVVVGLMAPFYAVLSRHAGVHGELDHALFGVVCWVPLVMALASRGFLRRQHTLPVGSGTLVGWTLANGALAVAITCWLVALSFNALFHTGWPLREPAWWAVVIYVAFQAAVWSVAGALRGLLIPVVFVALLAAFGPHLHKPFAIVNGSDAAPAWPSISTAELAASLVVVAGFYLASVYVVGRNRRGEAWSLASLGDWWANRVGEGVSTGTTAANKFTPRSFRSRRAAQFWMEWRSKGRYVPLAVAATVGLLWVIAASDRSDPFAVSGAVAELTVMLMLTSPFVGLYLGHRSERFDMKPLLATRPLGDDELAMIVLRHAAVACGAGAIVWLIGVALTVAVWGWAEPYSPDPLFTGHDTARLLLLKAWRSACGYSSCGRSSAWARRWGWRGAGSCRQAGAAPSCC